MKAKKKGLQKFTKTETKIKEILKLDKVTPEIIDGLSEQEKKHFQLVVSEIFLELKGDERDKFYRKFEVIADEAARNQLWEFNHVKITNAISSFMKDFGRMPTRIEIANKTELSRQTIYKHFKDYFTHPQYLEHVEQFRFMTSKVMAKIYQFAINGDMRAAKLYLNAMGSFKGQSNSLIQNQNNYIQINGIVLSQETVKHLNPEQLKSIEMILRTVVQPEVLSMK